MSMKSLFIFVLLLGGGYYFYQSHEASILQEEGYIANLNGFMPFPSASQHQQGTIYVVAAKNCTREEAERANWLAETLDEKGLNVKRTHQVQFIFNETPKKAVRKKIDSTINGPLPLVFINGKVANNPTLDEVLLEANHHL